MESVRLHIGGSIGADFRLRNQLLDMCCSLWKSVRAPTCQSVTRPELYWGSNEVIVTFRVMQEFHSV